MKPNKLFFLLIILSLFFLIPSGREIFAQNNNETQIDSVKILLIDEKYDESINLLNNILKEDSSNVKAYYYLSICYQNVSNFEKAAEALYRALYYKPNDLKIMISLGNDLIASGRLSDAKDILSTALMRDSVNKEVLNSLGNVLMQKHDWGEALKIYNNLIKIDSNKSFYYERAARCSAILEDTSSAIVNYQIALRLNPKNEQTILELCRLYISKKEFFSAERIIDNALIIYPGLPGMWSMKGKILLGMKEYKNAIDNYYESINLGDTTLTNFRDIGICYYYSEQCDTAVVYLNTAIRINDNDPASYFYLGSSYKELKKYDLASANLSAAAGLLKNNFLVEVYTQLGALYYSKKNYKEALHWYRDALREKPDKLEINFYLAVVYDHYYEDKTVAINYYKKFLADSTKTDEKLVSYSKERLGLLKEANFMNGKH